MTTTTSIPWRSPASTAASSPSCLESGYASPSQSRGYSVSSFAGRSFVVGPFAEIVEVSTTRRRPSAAAASTATTGACAFIRHTSSAGLEPTKPTVWKRTSWPLTARRIAA